MDGSYSPDLVRYVLDLETEGVRSTRYDRVLGFPPRTMHEGLRISQFSMIDQASGDSVVEGFTDLINKTLLAKHGVNVPKEGMTKDEAIRVSKSLPQSFMDDLVTRRAKGYWDPDVVLKESVLRGVMERHVQAVLMGEKVRAQRDYINDVYDNILMQLDAGKKVEIAGWNTGFDWGRLAEGSIGDEELLRKLNRIQTHRAFKVVDAAEPIREIAFHSMLEDPNFNVKFTDYAKLEKMAKEGNVDLREGMRNHRALRTFMDDVSAAIHTKSNQPFLNRLSLVEKHPEYTPEKAKYIAEELGKVRDYKSFSRMAQGIRKNEELTGLNDLFRAMYLPDPKDPDAFRHINILGKGGRDTDLLGNGFNMILGWRQESIVNLVAQLDGKDSAFAKLAEQASHDARNDTQLSSALHKRLREILKEGPSSKAWKAIRYHLQDPKDGAARVLAEIRMRLEGQRGGSAAGIDATGASFWQRMNEFFGNKGTKFWGKVGLAAAGMYVLGQWNKEDAPIEGVRTPYGMWDQMEGINPNHPGTDFGSGRDSFRQLLGTSYYPWVDASALGLRGEPLYNVLQNLPYSSNEIASSGETIRPSRFQEATQLGRYYHRLITQALGDHIIQTEYPIEDPYYKIKGTIDAILEGNIPLEIKTVADAYALADLQGPKGPAASQANYYAHAMGAPYALVAYVARNDPSHWKLFTVPRDEQRLVDDLVAARVAAQQVEDSTVGNRLDMRLWDEFTTTMQKIQYKWVPPIQYNPLAPAMATQPGGWDGMRNPGDFGRYHRRKFFMGYGGKVQRMHDTALKSKISDKRAKNRQVQPSLGHATVAPKSYVAGTRRESVM